MKNKMSTKDLNGYDLGDCAPHGNYAEDMAVGLYQLMSEEDYNHTLLSLCQTVFKRKLRGFREAPALRARRERSAPLSKPPPLGEVAAEGRRKEFA